MESGELLECGLWNGEISGVEVEGRRTGIPWAMPVDFVFEFELGDETYCSMKVTYVRKNCGIDTVVNEVLLRQTIQPKGMKA
eukprot:scaffold1478_cov213-Alexandrium_tamarense.AAC.5